MNIEAVGGSNVLALDREGRLWLADSHLKWVRSAVSPVDPPFIEERTLIQGIDHIKDISGGLLLKEDGTVWTSACQQQACDIIKSMRAGSPKKIEGLEDIVKLSGYGLALKKDGTVWIWGLGSLAVQKTRDSFASAAPFQIEGLSGIVDIAFNGGRLLAVKNDGTVWGMGWFSTRFWGKIRFSLYIRSKD